MKFRDGMWLVAEGMRVEYAEDVYEITETKNGLGLLCPTKHIRDRGDTLNLSTLTIDIEAAFDGVISVETTHWAGAANRGPHFDLYPDGRPAARPEVSRSAERGTTLRSGSISATVHPDPHTFDIGFHGDGGGRLLTALGRRSVGLAYSPAPSNANQLEALGDFRHYVFTQTNLGVGESIHGLGERFGAFNKVGQAVALWNADGGTSSEQAYKNVSLMVSSRGYGVFVDHAGRVELEVGSERCSRVQASVAGQRLRWFVIDGPTPRDVLARYAVLTGRAPAVPAWSYGLWLSTSFTTSYDDATVGDALARMRARGIAVDVFHYDCFWMRAFRWTDFVFDRDRFPDPAGQIARLKAAGLARRVCVWVNPYIAQHGAAFAHAAAHGYLLRRRSSPGDVWQWDQWQAGMGLVDFTNPAAAAWFADAIGRLLDLGVDAVKTDFGERIPTRDVAWHDPSVDPDKMHNYYAFLYNAAVYGALRSRNKGGVGGPADDGAVLFARAACAGTQRFPVQWGGDCESTPEAMAESVRGGLGLGLSGFAFWSVDIGGFEGAPAPWLYKRWVALGLLCSHSRLHGSGTYRVPWSVDGIDGDGDAGDSCTAVLRGWTGLKNRLMPYLLAQGRAAAAAGLPLSLRALCIDFPDDPTAWFLDRQFMVGDGLLAAPVFAESGEVDFYLPAGEWTCFFTGRSRRGPGWFRERHGFASMPLYVRENTVLVLGPPDVVAACRGAVYDYLDRPEVCLYHVADGLATDVVDCHGNLAGTLGFDPATSQVTGLDVFKGSHQVCSQREIEDSFLESIQWL